MARKSRKNAGTAIQPDVPNKACFKAGAYVRLSVEDRKHKGDSIETQQAIIRAFIDEQDDLELQEIYIDNGLSGQTFERPAFLRMKDDIESGKINCCITKDLSRLGRNAIDTGFYIESYFPKHGVRYIAIADGYDSACGNIGGIMVSLKNMANEAYALETGRKIRAYHQTLTSEGGFAGAHSPYGYLKHPEDVHRLIPDEYAAPIVRRIFEMYVSGKGLTAITEWLNESGILPPKRYFHSIGLVSEKQAQGHIHWGTGSVNELLNNRVYCGDIVRGKNKTKNHLQERMPKTDWVVVEDKHEAIVSRELFDKVQQLRKKANTSPKQRFSTPNSANIFTGKIVCGHCGHGLGRKRGSESSYSFSCITRYTYAKTDCVPVNISEAELKEKLLDMLRFFNIEIARDDTDDDIKREKAELQEVQAELRKNHRLIDGLYESLISRDITDAEYKEFKTAYASKIIELTEREKLLRQAEQERIKEETRLSKASASLNTAQATYDLTAEIVGGLIEKIHVFDDKSLRVKFTFRDDEIPSREAAVYE